VSERGIWRASRCICSSSSSALCLRPLVSALCTLRARKLKQIKLHPFQFRH